MPTSNLTADRTTDTTTVLKINQVSKHYQDGSRKIEVLRDLSFRVSAGESLSVTGPSGCGKSTLLNLLAGLISPDSGSIMMQLAGQSFACHEADEGARTAIRRQHIGYIYQFFNLVPTLTVMENVLLPGHLNRRRDLANRAKRLLEDFGLADRAENYPEVLSGGEQQRVAVARSLLLKPPLLLADEPTGNLDANNSAQVAGLLFNSCRELNISLVIATHSMDIAAMADHQLHLDFRPSP